MTLGTPHHGTRLARPLQALPLIGQLTPQSAVIQELSQPAVGIRTRFVAFYSDIDHLIWPRRHARIEHPDLNARNIAAPGIGHLSMPNNSRIAFTIAGALRELDPYRGSAEGKAGLELTGSDGSGQFLTTCFELRDLFVIFLTSSSSSGPA